MNSPKDLDPSPNNMGVARRFFQLLNAQNVVYCHWKSIDHLDDSYEAKTDLDVLVERHDSHLLESVARGIGFIECDTPNLRTYPGVRDLVCYDPLFDRFVHLHLHCQLVMGDRWTKAYRVPVEREILDRRVWCEEYDTYTVSPEDEFWMCVLRMAWKYKRPFSR